MVKITKQLEGLTPKELSFLHRFLKDSYKMSKEDFQENLERFKDVEKLIKILKSFNNFYPDETGQHSDDLLGIEKRYEESVEFFAALEEDLKLMKSCRNKISELIDIIKE